MNRNTAISSPANSSADHVPQQTRKNTPEKQGHCPRAVSNAGSHHCLSPPAQKNTTLLAVNGDQLGRAPCLQSSTPRKAAHLSLMEQACQTSTLTSIHGPPSVQV
eukprot:scaffold14315_cov20-Tisochrysis_lutea.AAC.1